MALKIMFSNSSSVIPFLMIFFKSIPLFQWRHNFKNPSGVSLILLHLSQKLWDNGAMNPIFPLEKPLLKYLAGPEPIFSLTGNNSLSFELF